MKKKSAINKSVIAAILTTAIVAVFLSGFLSSQYIDAQRVDVPRIAPVQKADWTDAQREILAPYAEGDRLYNVYTTMANYPELMRDWIVFAGHVLRRNSLPDRDREILILRIGWLCQSEYEWSRHVIIGRAVGLSEEDIQRIIDGPTGSTRGLSKREWLLLQATDELHQHAFITDTTWYALAEIYDKKQMMDIVFTVGEYNLVSMALNSFGVQLDEGVDGFPK